MVMNLKFVIWTVLLLIILQGSQAALIEGNIYDYNLYPVRGAVISINTSPSQQMVATAGTYQFRAQPGNYLLTAEYTATSNPASTTTNIIVEQDGTFTHDLVLFPSYIEEAYNESEFVSPFVEPKSNAVVFILLLLVVALILLLVVAAAFILIVQRERKKLKIHHEEIKEHIKVIKEEKSKIPTIRARAREIPAPAKPKETVERININHASDDYDMSAFQIIPEKEELSDTEKVKVFIKTHTPTTQKDIRQAFPLISEAKISLIISDLENQGNIRKFKKGRGNVVKETTSSDLS